LIDPHRLISGKILRLAIKNLRLFKTSFSGAWERNMEAWFTSNLILTLIVAPAVSYLAVNSVYEIASWNRSLYRLAKDSSVVTAKLANDLTYDVKMQAQAAEIAKASTDGVAEAP
jgi:hypothetical protein